MTTNTKVEIKLDSNPGMTGKVIATTKIYRDRKMQEMALVELDNGIWDEAHKNFISIMVCSPENLVSL